MQGDVYKKHLFGLSNVAHTGFIARKNRLLTEVSSGDGWIVTQPDESMIRIICVLLLLACQSAAASVSSSYYLQWIDLIDQPFSQLSQQEKVFQVDRYINTAAYRSDQQLFGVEDYWSDPAEFIRRGQGDCEDFAIAKFFTLLSMGVDESKLQLVFGRLSDGTKHMLVAYQEQADSEPMLLDNLTLVPTPASLRQDFLPVYSFNRSEFWFKDGWNNGEPIAARVDNPKWQRVLNVWNAELLVSR